MEELKINISNISNNDFKIIINGLKVLKDRHYYSEVYKQAENYKYKDSQKTKLYRLKAECKYQDKEIPSNIRFQEALKFLDELEDDAETLSLKGAIFKRKYFLKKRYKRFVQSYKLL